MIKLIIGNSYSHISGLSPSQDKALRSILSYDLDPKAAYFAGGHRGARRCLMNKRGEFPTGLLTYVQAYTGTLPGEEYTKDIRVRPTSSPTLYSLKLGCIPYPEQIDIVKECTEAHRGTISACTGFGKSLTMALLVKALNVKTLIVVPNLGLKQQLIASFRTYFGSLDHITIENIDSPRLKSLTNFDCLIIDEAHHSAAKTYRDLNKKAWGGIYYRFFFTATAFRSKDEEQMLLESVAGQVIYSIDYKQARDKGYVVPIEAYYIELPRVLVKGRTWAQVYSELVVNNKERNRIIAELLLRLNANKLSTLCLTKEVKHGKNITDITRGSFASGDDTEDCQQLISWFNQKELPILTATTGVCGEGVDTKPAEYVIITGLGKSKNLLMQNIGRVLRTYPGKESGKVIIFKDKSHKWTLAHFREQCRVLREEYGVEPVKLETT